jgi:hypothetical protein
MSVRLRQVANRGEISGPFINPLLPINTGSLPRDRYQNWFDFVKK